MPTRSDLAQSRALEAIEQSQTNFQVLWHQAELRAMLALQRAAPYEKRAVFKKHLKLWMRIVGNHAARVFKDFLGTAPQRLHDPDRTIDWAYDKTVDLLKFHLGDPPHQFGTADAHVDNWREDGGRAFKDVVHWVAAVTGSRIDLDSQIASWRAPAWLDEENGQVDDKGRLGKESTELLTAEVHFRIWGVVGERLQRARGQALIDIAAQHSDYKKKSGRLPPLTETQKNVRYAIRKGWEGRKFAEKLDQRRTPPLASWKEWWPGSWVAAYKDKRHRHNIYSLKTKERQRMERNRR